MRNRLGAGYYCLRMVQSLFSLVQTLKCIENGDRGHEKKVPTKGYSVKSKKNCNVGRFENDFPKILKTCYLAESQIRT